MDQILELKDTRNIYSGYICSIQGYLGLQS